MNLSLLKKIAGLGKLGYEPDSEVTVVKMTTNAPEGELSHLRPRYVLVDDDGVSHIDARILHELEQDLSALIASCGIKTDGRPLHELVPYAAQRIGELDEHYSAHPPETEDAPEAPEEDVPEDANTD